MFQDFLPKLFTSVSPLSLSIILLGSVMTTSALMNGALGMDSEENSEESPTSSPRQKKKVKAEKFDAESFKKQYATITDSEKKYKFLNKVSLPPAGEDLRIHYMMDLAMELTTPKTGLTAVGLKALRWLAMREVENEEFNEKIRPTVINILQADELRLFHRIELLPLCKDVPVPILFSILKQISSTESLGDRQSLEKDLRDHGANLINATFAPEKQEEIERFFSKFPEVFAKNPILNLWISYFWENSDPVKRDNFLSVVSQGIETVTDVRDKINLISLFLEKKKDPEQAHYHQLLWKNILEAEQKGYLEQLPHACASILQSSSNLELKKTVMVWLFNKTSNFSSPKALSVACECLQILLEWGGPNTKLMAIKSAAALLNTGSKLILDDLYGLVKVLKKIPEGKDLKNEILMRIISDFRQAILTQSKPDDLGESDGVDSEESDGMDPANVFTAAQMLLSVPTPDIRNEAHAYFKNILIEKNDDYAPEDAANAVVDELGIDHPWAQEAVHLMVAQGMGDDPRSCYGVHHLLLEKRKEIVEHHPQTVKLNDGRLVSFDLETLKKIRQRPPQVPLVKHSELLVLVEKLIKEIEKNPQALEAYKIAGLDILPQRLRYTAKDDYFQRLLDTDEAVTPMANVSLINLKLRNIIRSIQSLSNQPTLSSGELSPQSKQTLQLLINVTACDTNKDNGVDSTDRLLNKLPLVSEDIMQAERLYKDIFMEEMRQMREGFLDGEGPVVKQLLFPPTPPKDAHVIEPPHQGKYANSLLSNEIGTALEGETVPFDLNGGVVALELREYSKQQVLDVLYNHFTVEHVLKHYHEKFKDKAFHKLIMAYVGVDAGMLGSRGYAIIEDDDFKSWTPLAAAEVLLRLNILDVVSDKKN